MMRNVPALLLLAAVATPASAQAPKPRAQAVFAGGCFWCTEADFDKIPGVLSTTSGYTGGKLANPTYKQVSAGGTGHIEAVRVVYDPTKVSYAALASRFFGTIDAVDAGGQFCDRGHQYRSAIFIANPEQRRIAEGAKAQAARRLKVSGPIATLILPVARFYPAEAYHQDYYKKNPIRYRFYRYSCGRDARLKQVWGG
jgi:peptide-methionine (S)-S-oxide reductase